jgi:hypothetical protein
VSVCSILIWNVTSTPAFSLKSISKSGSVSSLADTSSLMLITGLSSSLFIVILQVSSFPIFALSLGLDICAVNLSSYS